MGFFEYYFGITEYKENVPVCCPFPHTTDSGVEYFEHHPSAHVSLSKRMFHCKVCQRGYSEATFVMNLLNCTFANATRLIAAFSNTETYDEWIHCCEITDAGRELAHSYGITDEVIEQLKMASQETMPGVLSFPVFYMKKLLDVRNYNPGSDPKVLSRKAAMYGLVIPRDIWVDTPLNKITLICAGEKDMATTRSHGFNAITITGGESTLPFSPNDFKNRDVVILYDNDNAGKHGAKRLASYLIEFCHTVKVCTAFHEVCKEDKEDMTDYWNKYNGTKEQLIQYMNNTPVFTEQDKIQDVTQYPSVTLVEATTPKYINRMVRSNIQVVAVSETQYVVPTELVGEKYMDSGKDDQMYNGEVREWKLTENNLQDVLHLADNGFKEADINNNSKMLMKVPYKEKYVKITRQAKEVLYKGYVTDMFESVNTDSMPMEYTAYSVGTRLESGKKYNCTYKLVPHPYKGQQLVMIILNAVPANDSVSNFKVDDSDITELKKFQTIPGNTEEKINTLVQKVKGLLGYDGNDLLIKVIDLSFHTVLGFNLGQFKNVRGYLDTLIIGESRVGKSSTADALRKTYQLGTFTSLAGNSATVPGLIGGSNKTASGMQTKAGLIPQNHKGLIIFEEFGKCNNSIVTELTDIRSSNEVRITRVSGTLTLPAMVRMISLSNVKAGSNGEIKSISSYPNGLSIISELVPTAEDIARYDMMCVLSDKGNAQINPFWKPEEPMDDEAYQTRIRWIWSRRPEQIIITEEVGNRIIQMANSLNKEYDCHIKIFGTEAWKKVSRLAIAIAGYLVSTDDSYQFILVKNEHVDYAAFMLQELYDNPTFRLKEYVESERKYSIIDDNGIAALQNLYERIPSLLLALEQESKPTKTTLCAAAGLENKDYNAFIAQLVKESFVKLNNNDVIPTERFRLGMSKIQKTGTKLTRLGENNV